jgi:hypothetical protein
LEVCIADATGSVDIRLETHAAPSLSNHIRFCDLLQQENVNTQVLDDIVTGSVLNMPVNISNNDGSMRGFDIVLALSEEAINASLQKLYDTEIEQGSLPPPTEIPDFAPLPQATHFINHRLSLHRLNSKKSKPGSPVYLEAGIEGWIECPKVRFRPILDLGQAVTADARYKNASVELKFTSGPDGQNSTVKYFDREMGDYDIKILDGMTMAWSVKIGRLDVQDIMNGMEDATLRTHILTSMLQTSLRRRSTTHPQTRSLRT